MYNNGKIYKLWCIESDLIYIGSTCNPLYKRFYQHKKLMDCSSKKLFELSNNVKIELIEEYPCNNKMELNRKEGEHIRLNKEKCLNSYIAGRTKKESQDDNYQKNKEKILLRQKEYREVNKKKMNIRERELYEVNKEKINLRKKELYEANKEKIHLRQKEYREKNKEKIKEMCKKYYEANKEKINLKKKENREAKKN